MALRDALRRLCDLWPDVVERFGEDSSTFWVLMNSVVDNPDDNMIQLTLMRKLFEVLPADHPIFRALSDEDDRSPEAAERWARTIADLARRLGR